MRQAQACVSPRDQTPGLTGAEWKAIWRLPPSVPVLTFPAWPRPRGTPRAASRLVVSDLFSAGVITTSATLAWALLLLILHPDVQREPSPRGQAGWGREERDSLRPLSLVGLATSSSSVQRSQ